MTSSPSKLHHHHDYQKINDDHGDDDVVHESTPQKMMSPVNPVHDMKFLNEACLLVGKNCDLETAECVLYFILFFF